MSEVLEPYSPLPTQQKFHDALNGTGEFANVLEYDAGEENGVPIHWPGYKYVCYMGGVGSGKTTCAVAQGVDNSLEWPGNVGVVCRLYATDLDVTTKKAYCEYLEEHDIDFEEVKSEGLIKIYNITVKPSLIYFRQLEDVWRFGSLEVGWAHIEEARELRDDYAFTYLKHRLRYNWKMPPLNSDAIRAGLKPGERAPYRRNIFLTTNPPNEDHWLAKWFPDGDMVAEGKEKRPFGHLLLQASTYENRKFLPPGYIEDLEHTLDESWRNVQLMGKYGFMADGTPVYQGFKESLHVSKLAWNSHLPVYRAWDFGFHHPAVVWSQIDNNGRWFILREMMGNEIILPEFIKAVIARSNEWFPGAYFKDCCDIAGSQVNDKTDKTSIQMLEDAGIQPLARRSSPKVGGPDISRVQKMLNTLVNGKPALMVDESCQIIIRGFSGGYYVENPKDGRQMGDIEPKKDGWFEHLMDCVRYTASNFLESEAVKAAKNIEIQGPRWW